MDYNMFLLARAEELRRKRVLAEQSQYDAMPTPPPSHGNPKLRRLLFYMGNRLVALGNRLKSDNTPAWMKTDPRTETVPAGV